MPVQSSVVTRSAMSFGSACRACAERLMAILRTHDMASARRRNHPVSEFRRVHSRDAAEHCCGEQAVSRQITQGLGARDADRRAAGCEQVRKWPALLVQHARLAVDRKAALRME